MNILTTGSQDEPSFVCECEPGTGCDIADTDAAWEAATESDGRSASRIADELTILSHTD